MTGVRRTAAGAKAQDCGLSMIGRLVIGAWLLWLMTAASAQDLRPALLILDFEIEDDILTQGGPVDVAENERRLQLARGIVFDAYAARGPFRLLDNSTVDALIASTRRTQALHTCNGCELEIARKAGAQFVLVGWVQKVSNLILNINAGVRRVSTGEDVLIRSVDLRGNTDASWERASARLGREMIERLERAPPRP